MKHSPIALFVRPAAFGSMLLALCHAASAASPPWLTAHDDKIKAIVEKMTLAEKVGQMTQPDSGSVKDLDDITTLTGLRQRRSRENKTPAPRDGLLSK